MKNRKKLIIGGVIIALAVFGLAYAVVMGGSTYYYEVEEFLNQDTSMISKSTKVHGEVGADLIIDDLAFSFSLLDATGSPSSMSVIYRGQVPNAFEIGRLVVVEGKLDSDGVFQATDIITKCTSKD